MMRGMGHVELISRRFDYIPIVMEWLDGMGVDEMVNRYYKYSDDDSRSD